MLKSLIGKAIRVIDDVGVETVLTLAFVAQIAVYALPPYVMDDVRVLMLSARGDVVETGTVVQMPAKPSGGGRAQRTSARDAKSGAKASGSATVKASRLRRPDPVDGEDAEQLRAGESSVRITIIGPDGEPRTKIVRLSGSRDGMAAPARRPHD